MNTRTVCMGSSQCTFYNLHIRISMYVFVSVCCASVSSLSALKCLPNLCQSNSIKCYAHRVPILGFYYNVDRTTIRNSICKSTSLNRIEPMQTRPFPHCTNHIRPYDHNTTKAHTTIHKAHNLFNACCLMVDSNFSAHVLSVKNCLDEAFFGCVRACVCGFSLKFIGMKTYCIIVYQPTLIRCFFFLSTFFFVALSGRKKDKMKKTTKILG